MNSQPFPPDPAAAETPYAGWRSAARSAGHPVVAVIDGRFDPEPLPMWSYAMPPNDLLEAAREYARSRVPWVHVVMPGLGSLLALGEAIQGPRPTGPAFRLGGPTATPWPLLVGEQHIGPIAVSITRDGVTRHALDVPVTWLSSPITRVGPPLDPADLAA